MFKLLCSALYTFYIEFKYLLKLLNNYAKFFSNCY